MTRILVCGGRDFTDWDAVRRALGLLRAAADSGFGALQRAESRGYARGIEVAKREAERVTGESAAQRSLTDLRERVAAFEAASGLTLPTWEPSCADLGRVVALVQQSWRNPSMVEAQLLRQAEALKAQAHAVRSVAAALAEVTTPA